MTDQFSLSEKEFKDYKKEKVAKPLMWFGMVSIVMLFAGLTSAVIVRKGDGNWMHFELPDQFLWSSILIVISSITLILAQVVAKRDQLSKVFPFLLATLILGIGFVLFQISGFQFLVDNGVYFTGAEHNASGSFLYVITWLHIAHLLGGIIALLVVLFNAYKGQYNSKNLLGLQVCSIYWHFLGAMWIYLYLFFNMII